MNEKLKYIEAAQSNRTPQNHRRWRKGVSVLAMLALVIWGYAIAMAQEDFCAQAQAALYESAAAAAGAPMPSAAQNMPEPTASDTGEPANGGAPISSPEGDAKATAAAQNMPEPTASDTSEPSNGSASTSSPEGDAKATAAAQNMPEPAASDTSEPSNGSASTSSPEGDAEATSAAQNMPEPTASGTGEPSNGGASTSSSEGDVEATDAAQNMPEPTASDTGEPAEESDFPVATPINEAVPSDSCGMELLAAGTAPQERSQFVDRLDLSQTEAVSGDEITLTLGFSWKKGDGVKAGDYIVVTWPETGAARLECTACPDEIKYRNLNTVIATTARESGRLTITFNEAVEGVSLPDRWAKLELKFTAIVESGNPEHSAALTFVGGSKSNTVTVEKAGDYYSVYGVNAERKVADPNGNLDADWSLCLNHNKNSPGFDAGPSGGYIKLENPTEAQYAEFSGNQTAGNFQRVKRILYAKAALYPDYNYGVFQNELYYAITGMSKYDTTWQADALNMQKADVIAVADSAAYDVDIERRLEVVIYKSNDSKLQNTITAKLKGAPPPDTASLTVSKLVTGDGGEQDRNFHFTLSLFQPRQQGTTLVYPLTGTYSALRNGTAETITFDGTGKAEFTLKHDESLTITGIEKGFYYQIAEAEANTDGYTTTVQRPEPAGQLDSQSGFNNFDSCNGVMDEVSISFTNDKPAPDTAELVLKKLVTGAGGDMNRAFHFTINIVDGGAKPLSGTYQAYLNDAATSVVVDDNGDTHIALKHLDTLRITGIQRGFYYIITEDEADADGYTTTAAGPAPETQDAEKGGVNNWGSDEGAWSDVEVTFTNDKPAPAAYSAVIQAHKTLSGGLPPNGQFTFILSNSEGQEVARRTNDAQGNVSFRLELPELGAYTYALRELNDGRTGIAYDEHVCAVEIRVTAPDAISVTYDGIEGAAQFRNQYGYLLPETGGGGTHGYIGGGAMLILASLLSLYIMGLVRRKEGRP